MMLLKVFRWVVPLACFGVAALGAVTRVPGDYATIQAAVNAARAGDTILIAPGVYEGNIMIENKSNLVLRGDVKVEIKPEEVACCGAVVPELVASVVIKGTVLILRSVNIMLENFTVTGPGSGIIIQGTLVAPARDITVRYVAAIRNAKHGAEILGHTSGINLVCSSFSYNGYDGVVLDEYVSGVTIEYCEISYNGQISATGVGVRVGKYVKDITIRFNCIVGNAFAGIHPQ